MNHSLKKMLLIAMLLPASPASHAVVAGGIVSIKHTWPDKQEFDQVSFFQQISNDGGTDSHYYWASEFKFRNGDGGYIGLQNRGDSARAFNYSIWQAKGWSSGDCRYFNHENSGVQCLITVPWKTGRPYKLDVSKNGNLVTGVVTDLLDGTKTTVGVIEVPETFGKIYESSGFVEEFSQGNQQLSSCYAMGAQGSIFRNPIGDGKTPGAQRTYTYGTCNDPYVVQATCNDSACINTISNLGAVASPDAPTLPIKNSSDLAAETISTALADKDLIAIRSEDGRWPPNIFLPEPGALKWKSVFVDHRAGYNSSIHVNGQTTTIQKGQQLMYMSDGERWEVVNPL